MKVGFTGHQEIGPPLTVNWLSSVMLDAVRDYGVTLGVTCLAAGADQLYAGLLCKQDIPYIAVVPSKDYEDTFSNKEHLENYKELLSHAQEVIKLRFPKPSELAFFEAGKEVVNCSEMIFAVWNGKPARGLGGTGDIVEYALSNNRRIVHFNVVTREVIMRSIR
jgi:hypothetical protein